MNRRTARVIERLFPNPPAARPAAPVPLARGTPAIETAIGASPVLKIWSGAKPASCAAGVAGCGGEVMIGGSVLDELKWALENHRLDFNEREWAESDYNARKPKAWSAARAAIKSVEREK